MAKIRRINKPSDSLSYHSIFPRNRWLNRLKSRPIFNSRVFSQVSAELIGLPVGNPTAGCWLKSYHTNVSVKGVCCAPKGWTPLLFPEYPKLTRAFRSLIAGTSMKLSSEIRHANAAEGNAAHLLRSFELPS